MTERASITPRTEIKPKNSYFTQIEKEGIDFIPSGCTLLDCVLGGGWPLGRVSNIVGDKSSGKTLLAIEGCTNFHFLYPKGNIIYYEAESAFDTDYAAALGMPVDTIDFVGTENTIEELYELLEDLLEDKTLIKQPTFFVVDSLDGLSDRAEQKRKIDEGTYGSNKAKKLSEMFRRLISKLEECNVHLQFISQLRDNIGAMIGAKHKRSGGRALDFYASQVLWLTEIKKHKKTSRKIQRVTGIQVKAACKKNKIGLPFRDCEFPITFGYGVDDLAAHIEFLNKVDALEDIQDLIGWNGNKLDTAKQTTLIRGIKSKSNQDQHLIRQGVNKEIKKIWKEIEQNFIPKSSKY